MLAHTISRCSRFSTTRSRIGMSIVLAGLLLAGFAFFKLVNPAVIDPQGQILSVPAPVMTKVNDQQLTPADWNGILVAREQARYKIEKAGEGQRAVNPGHQWVTTFDRQGFLTRPADGGWQWGLQLTSYGFGVHQNRGQNRGPDHEVVQNSVQRITFRRDQRLEEWYINDQRGLEHGFNLMERPAGAATGLPLTINLQTRGTLTGVVSADARSIAFRRDDGATALNYAGLKVWDARGVDLPARFATRENGEISIVIDEESAVYPVTVDPIAQNVYFKADNANNFDSFGNAVAINGDTAVVGASAEFSSATGVNGDGSDNSAPDAGAAYVFVRTAGVWTQQAYLKASNAQSGDRFGNSVAIAGDIIVVGALQEDSNATGIDGDQTNNSATYAGAAYIFSRSGTTWTQQAYLKPSDTNSNDYFGCSVAVAGETVVVGAYTEDSNATTINGDATNNSASNSGAAYVFRRTGGVWSQEAYLKADNAQAEDRFGGAVAISGDTILAGASLEASNATGVNGDKTNNSAAQSGAVYVFTRSGSTWSQQAYLKASNTNSGDYFGERLAISGDTAVVSAPYEASNATGINGNESDNSATYAGAAYVFFRSSGTWSQQAYLKGSNTGGSDFFGSSVAIDGEAIVIGANNEASNATGIDGDGTNNSKVSGAAYKFTRSGSTWTQAHYIKASHTGLYDDFGIAVAISGTDILVGATSEDSNSTGMNGDPSNNSGNGVGAVYLFGTPNALPTITAASGLSRVTGQAASNSTIATVNDAETAAGSLTVTVTTANPSNGVTISNIVNSGGTITADIVAATGGSNATFTLQVSDGLATATATLNVTVTAPPPVVSGGFTVTSTSSEIGPGGIATIVQTLNNGSSTAAAGTYTVTIPAGLSALSGGCTSSAGSCTVGPAISPGGGLTGIYRKSVRSGILSNQSVSWTGTIPGNGSVTITYQVQVGAQAASGTQYCVTTMIGGSAGPSICVTVTAPQSGPGVPPLATSPGNQQKPGSVLIYNLYTSSANPAQSDTRVTLTNTNPVNPVSVHLFFVDGSTCAVANQFVTLTQNQTVSLQVSDVDPGVTGYLIAVATDAGGCPIISNDLIGESYVRFESGHMANLPALGVSGLAAGSQICNSNSVTATLAFDGVQYNELPRTLAIDSLAPPASGNSTMLVVNRIGGDLANGADELGSLAGLLFDDIEASQSFTLVGGTCQLRGILGNNFPRTAPRYTTVIPAGRTGWMKLWSTTDAAITGVAINEATVGFSQGHNLHGLTTTAAASLTIPVFPAR